MSCLFVSNFPHSVENGGKYAIFQGIVLKLDSYSHYSGKTLDTTYKVFLDNVYSKIAHMCMVKMVTPFTFP